MSSFTRLGKNTFLMFLGNIGGKLISFFMLPFYTRWLSLNDYGLVDLLGVYVTLILALAGFCITEAIFVFPKGASLNEQKGYFSSGLFFSIPSLIVTALVFFLLKLWLQSIGLDNCFTEYTWMIYFMIVANFFQAYVQQFARSIDKVRIYSIAGIIQAIVIALLSFFLMPNWGVMGFIYANLLSMFISGLVLLIGIKPHKYISLAASSVKKIKEMLRYSIPLIPNVIMWWLIGAINRPVIEHYLGTNAVGVFAVANKFPSIIAVFFTIFINSWQISVVDEFKKPGYILFYNKALRLIVFLLVLLSVFLGFFSKDLVAFVADKKFLDAWRFIPLLSIGVLFSSLSAMVGVNFMATKESKYFFYSSLWGAAVSILLNLLLIPHWGLWGACVSVIISHIVMTVARCYNSWKYARITDISVYICFFLINIILLPLLYFCNSTILRYLGFVVLVSLILIINYKLLKEVKAKLVLLIKIKGKF